MVDTGGAECQFGVGNDEASDSGSGRLWGGEGGRARTDELALCCLGGGAGRG